MNRIVVALGFLLTAHTIQAQGFKHKVGFQAAGFAKEGVIKETSPAAGLFYDYNFSNRFGIGVAVMYHKFYRKDFWYGVSTEANPDGPIFLVKFRYNYLDIPLNFKLNLNMPEAKGWRTDLLLGTTYSHLLHTIIRDAQTGKKLGRFEPYRWQKNSFYANLGLELKPNMGEKYFLGINPGVQAGVSDNAYDSFFYLQLRLGRKF